MIKRYTEKQFLSSKSYDKLALECKYCHKVFYKEKKFIQSSLKISSKNKSDFCSVKCGCSYNKQLKGQFSEIVLCKQCGEKTKKYGSEIRKTKNSFCSRSCSASYNNKKTRSDKTKNKIKNSLKLYHKDNKHLRPKFLKLCSCVICNKKFMHKKQRKTCGNVCLTLLNKMIGIKAGKKSSQKRVLRSRNEIALFELLSQKYKCLNNKPIFDGWDADIIIPDLKLAILWNGPWHYRKITKQHSLKQTQNRDKIKTNKMIEFGFSFLIIKDCDNKMTPEKAFEFILQSVENKEFNCSFY